MVCFLFWVALGKGERKGWEGGCVVSGILLSRKKIVVNCSHEASKTNVPVVYFMLCKLSMFRLIFDMKPLW